MSTPDDGGPAFPRATYVELDDNMHQPSKGNISGDDGMTLRDYFVGQLIAGLVENVGEGCTGYMEQRARVAYEFADALLAARKRPAS